MNKRKNTSARIPLVPIPITREEATSQAQANLEIIRKLKAFEDNAVDFLWELRQDNLPKARMNRLKKAADKINSAVMPYSACKSGCSYCCNISAVITQTEAINSLQPQAVRLLSSLDGLTSRRLRRSGTKSPAPS